MKNILLALVAIAGISQTANAARTYRHPTFFWVRGFSIPSWDTKIKDVGISWCNNGPADDDDTVQDCNGHWNSSKNVTWETYIVFTNIGSTAQDITINIRKNDSLPPGYQGQLGNAPISPIQGALGDFVTGFAGDQVLNFSSSTGWSRNISLAPNSSRLVYFKVNYPGPVNGGSSNRGLYGNIQFVGSFDLTVTVNQDTGGVLATGESFLTHGPMVTAPVAAALGGSVGQKFDLNAGKAL